MKKNFLTTSGIIVAIALFFAVHTMSGLIFRTARIDLTANHLFTLSDGTKNILSNLNEPITVRFYLSQSLMNEAQVRPVADYANRVKEMLQEYKRYAGGKLNLLIIDPEPFSDQEDRAESAGLKGARINEGADSFYFGLVGSNSTDDTQIIEFFSPERSEFLEHDLTEVVYKLANPKQLVVGVMTSLPLDGRGRQPTMPGQPAPKPWVIYKQLEQTFAVKKIDMKAEKIPSDVAVLVIVHPRGMGDKTYYAIDQFVMRGGRVMAFVDPYAESQPTNPSSSNFMASMQTPRNSEMKKLLDAWGVELQQSFVAADRKTAVRVQFNRTGRPVTYPVYMNVQPSQYNTTDIITKNLGQIVMASAGVLKKKERKDIEFVPLIKTTDQGMKIATSKLGMFAKPEEIMRQYRPEGKFTLAARITGKLKSAFPKGDPNAAKNGDGDKDKADDDKDKSKDSGYLAESKEPVNIIVVADADLLQDRYWVQVRNLAGTQIAIPSAANNTLVINAIENLVGSNDLISVRNRGTFARPFTKVKQLQQEAEQQFLQKANMLETQLREAERNLKQLQSQKENQNSLILSDEQKNELKKFAQQRITIRKELRQVQHELKKNINGLKTWLMFLNITLVPLLIILGSTGYYYYKRSKKPLLKAHNRKEYHT